MTQFYQNDWFTVLDERKYVHHLGWNRLIAVNNEFRCFIQEDAIEKLYDRGMICSSLELDLQLNYLNLKVNEALDAFDKESFLSFTAQLNHLHNLKEKIEPSLVKNRTIARDVR